MLHANCRAPLCWQGRGFVLLTFVVLLAQLSGLKAFAGGPRFVSGSGLAVSSGLAEGWNTTQLMYFTDPGNLAANVTHAQADAMVAAAAAVWNVPTSNLSLSRGGTLQEHVSSANSYFDGANFIFPVDVQTSNEKAVPVPVLYDTDGSVTDLLLGAGASEPVGCRQNAVTESVDDLQPDGYIHHAMLILNGRCVGGAPEQLTQMQYQLARAFGRILGIAWSQTNDNVFTAATTVTADQEAYWPLMHPLDVFCGTYSYQCMPNPFTLRPDDLSAMAFLYPVSAGNVPPGKQVSANGADFLYLSYHFPTGQGMALVNVTATRQQYATKDDYEIVSGVTGGLFQQSLASPVTGVQAVNEGSSNSSYETYAFLREVPLGGVPNIFLTTEPINSLYSGEYAIAPYAGPPTTPSGSAHTAVFTAVLQGPDSPVGQGLYANDAASNCYPGNDGVESAPVQLDNSGWQTGLLCGWGHSSWWSATVRAGRTWALEVTATDETGAASTGKSQPVMGLWNAADATGTLPTLASAAVPFNSMAIGVTQIQMPSSSKDLPVRFVIGDEYGVGRPDFTYTARLLYADNVSPATVGAGGGTITITGTGFRQGNLVQVNGQAAVVRSWSSTQIVAVAPNLTIAGTAVGVPVTVTVRDTTTNGSSTIANALTYNSAPDTLQQVSAPAKLETNVASAVPFAVRVLASDGTPVAGATVEFIVTAGSATFGICGGVASCTVTSDANGLVQTTVSGVMLGSVTLIAAEASETALSTATASAATLGNAVALGAAAAIQITLNDVDPIRDVTFSNPVQYAAAGFSGNWQVQLNPLQDGSPVAGVPVTWAASSGVSLAYAPVISAQNGAAVAIVDAGIVGAGAVNTVTGCAWTTVCATWTVYGVDASQWQVAVSSGSGQSLSEAETLGSVGLLVTDAAGHVLSGAPVEIHQRVLAWEGSCPGTGTCPAAAVLASSATTVISDNNGALSITPLQIAGVPQTVEIAVSTGTQGFVTLTLVKTPRLSNQGGV
ncbi:MAG: Ig-like domain-containing protein [Janthinobacterium lividum]